jgi:hypothetical protein
MRLWLVLFAALFTAPCAALGAGSHAGVTMVLLERDACYGTCPEYSVRATRDGAVQFNGKSWVKEFGRHEGRMSPESFQRVVQAVEAVDFDRLPPEFPCPELSTCATTMWITVMKDSNLKRVAYYFGCKGAREDDVARFVELGKRIDEFVGTSKWVGRESERRATASDPN